MIALVGDKLWLLYDTVLKPANDWLHHGVVYAVVGLTFGGGLALMAWSVVLYRRNGYAHVEIRDEIAHRRDNQRRQRFLSFIRRGDEPRRTGRESG